jgi:hypothetical protein
MPVALDKIHSEALKRFDAVEGALHDERLQCLKDRRFYSIAGAQWEGTLGEQYENKPKFEINKIHLSVMRIINDYRNNRITVDFVNKDEHNDSALAETLNGLYRADEQDSGADEAYDNAFEEAVGGGFGAWRVRTIYEDAEDEDNDHQRIAIEPIYDADSSVYFDPASKRQDKRDAKWCFVVTSMTPDDFKEQYPKHDPSGWDKSVEQCEFDWCTPESIYIAEYYVIKETQATIHIYTTIGGNEEKYTDQDFENDDTLKSILKAIGTEKTGQKKVTRQKVHKYLLSGTGILEDYGLIAGNCIPIVPVFGKRWFVDNVERCMGHVRLSKDSQRLKNMEMSKLAEISALSPIEKPVFTPEQVMGHETRWAKDNLKNYPYMLINSTTDKDGNQINIGPAAYTKPPAVPPALAALLTITDTDLDSLLGKPDTAVQDVAANLSGKAIELVQTRLDMQAFIYMSNFAKAMKRAGEIWLSMAKEVYVETSREVRLIDANLQAFIEKLNTPGFDKKTGAQVLINDISRAKCLVAVNVGPSSSTKRNATARALIAMSNMNQDPETAKILGQMILMNIEGEGIDDARAYFRLNLVRAGVLQPTAKESEKLAIEAKNAQPSANDTYLIEAAKAQAADAAKSRSDVIKNLAGAEKLKAETMNLLSTIDQTELTTAISVLGQLRDINNTATVQPQ